MNAPARYRWRKPRPLTAILVAGAVLTLIGLGTWQLQRMEWKNGMVQDIIAANRAAPITTWPKTREEFADLGWRRAQLTGRFLNGYEFHLAARYHNGELGYHILTPFRLQDGRIVLLNRGWVPTAKKEASSRAEGQIEGIGTLESQIRTDDDRSAFTPEADPAKNLWFWRDIEQMKKASGLPLEPITADVVGMIPQGGLPISSDGTIRIQNDHLGYAITWFALALAAAVMFFIYHYRPEEKPTA